MGFFPSEGGGPALALTSEEHMELWAAFWHNHPLRDHMFGPDNNTEDAVFRLSGGQVRNQGW